MTDDARFAEAAAVLRSARRAIAFTGAGISVESGIPPFRGAGGVWERFDPGLLEISAFLREPAGAWPLLRDLFYDTLAGARPNPAHLVLAALERQGIVRAVVTQNVDGLHRAAGSRTVHELHGSLARLTCLGCQARYAAAEVGLAELPPTCRMCGGVLRPGIVFFGEPLPEPARADAFGAAARCDALLVIGTSGEVMPAALLPRLAAERGATVIEVNPAPSAFTDQLTDLFLPGPAGAVMARLAACVARPPA